MKKKKAKPLFKIPDPNDARKAIIEDFERQKKRLIEDDDASLEDLVQLTEMLKKQSKKKR
jgi:predicted AAA+ superfamily ATPase